MVVISNCALVIAFLLIGVAALIICVRRTRVQAQSLIIVGDGAAEITLLLIGVAAKVINVGGFWA